MKPSSKPWSQRPFTIENLNMLQKSMGSFPNTFFLNPVNYREGENESVSTKEKVLDLAAPESDVLFSFFLFFLNYFYYFDELALVWCIYSVCC